MVGPNAPELASSYNNLAVIQRQLGKLDEAEANYDKALTIRIPVLGREHPETADTLNNLAALLLNRGRYGEAAAAFEEVSAIYTRLYGDKHSRTVTAVPRTALLSSILQVSTEEDSPLVDAWSPISPPPA